MAAVRHDNFDLIRISAALTVWYAHSRTFYDLPDLLSFEYSGVVAVFVFFIVSGYFIAASYDHHKRLIPFIKNRLLRIYPALAVVILLSVFVLGPFVTTLSLHDYFTHPMTWDYLKSLSVFYVQYTLPGVFTDTTPAVNLSLWTLPHEMFCYDIIAVVGALGLLYPHYVLAIVVGLCVTRFFGDFGPGNYASDIERGVNLCTLFMGGAFMYMARGKIPFKREFFAIALVILITSAELWGECVPFELALVYLVIYLGFLKTPWLPNPAKYGDFSYGIYLYAYPVQQLTLYVLKTPAFEVFLIVSFAGTLACAVASWHFIEKPALAFKSRRAARAR